MTPHPADALLAGATGLVGRAVAAAWPGPGTLHLLVRRDPGDGLARRPHVAACHVDYAALPALPPAGSALCCLGTTIAAAGSQAAFRAVDFDAVVAFARAARAAGVGRFAVVSALGADPRAGNFYSRVKGEAEAALVQIGFATLVVARPSLLVGDRAALGQAPRPAEALAQRVARPLAPLIPRAWRPVDAATVARALLRALADARPGRQVLDNAALHALGAR